MLWKMNLIERPGFAFGLSEDLDENKSYIVIEINETN